MQIGEGRSVCIFFVHLCRLSLINMILLTWHKMHVSSCLVCHNSEIQCDVLDIHVRQVQSKV